MVTIATAEGRSIQTGRLALVVAGFYPLSAVAALASLHLIRKSADAGGAFDEQLLGKRTQPRSSWQACGWGS